MEAEPRIALAASPREWAGRLHRHVTDHGGASVRATVLHPRDALVEDYDVFIADDCTSFLTRRLVEELHQRGRGVLGVYDADDPVGKGELADLGVDQAITRDAPPEEFLAAVRTLGGAALRAHADLDALVRGVPPMTAAPAPVEPAQTPARGPLIVVAGSGGGVGTSEVAVNLAAVLHRRDLSVVAVDADGVAPSLAQRVGAPPYPNIRAALEAFEEHATLDSGLVASPASGLQVVPGLSNPDRWSELRPAETVELLRALTVPDRHVLVDAGHRFEDLHTLGGPGRYALPRTLLGAADAVIVIAHPSPVGMTRLLAWLAQTAELAAAVHVVFNRAPQGAFKQSELITELTRTITPASLWLLPGDPRVEAAAWAGTIPTRGPFVKAIEAMAAGIVPTPSASRRRSRARAKVS